MADLLAANPSGASRKVTKDHQPARGTLLHASEQEKAKNRRSILQTNMRSSSYAQAPTDQRRAGPSRAASGFGIPQQQTMMAGYNYNGLPTSTSNPMFAGANSYFPSPTAGFQQQGMGMPMMMPGYAQPQMQMPMQIQANPALKGYGQQMGYGMPMNMNMGVPIGMAAGAYEEAISPQQRDNIDRWRMSVAPQ
jgi:hypothetical protein